MKKAIMLFRVEDASATISRTTCTAKTKQQAKQRYFAMPVSSADGTMGTRRIRICGGRNVKSLL